KNFPLPETGKSPMLFRFPPGFRRRQRVFPMRLRFTAVGSVVGSAVAENGGVFCRLMLGVVLLISHGSIVRSSDGPSGPAPPGGSSSLPPKVVRYCQRILDQLGQEDPRGLPLELWPNGREAAEEWDANRDGFLSARELAETIQNYARHRSLRVLALPPLAPHAAPNGPSPDSPRLGPVKGGPATMPSEQDARREDESSPESGTPEATRTPRSGHSRPEAIFQVAPS